MAAVLLTLCCILPTAIYSVKSLVAVLVGLSSVVLAALCASLVRIVPVLCVAVKYLHSAVVQYCVLCSVRLVPIVPILLSVSIGLLCLICHPVSMVCMSHGPTVNVSVVTTAQGTRASCPALTDTWCSCL